MPVRNWTLRAGAAITRAGNHLLPVSALSPVIAFPALWLIAVAAAQIHVLAIQSSWSATVWGAVALVPVTFIAGGLAAQAGVRRLARGPHRHPAGSVLTPRRFVLIGLLVVGYAELVRQFAAAGTIPLFSSHIDSSRIGLPQGWIALLLDALTVAAVLAIAAPRRLLAREARFELAVAVLALGGYALSGGREVVAIAAAAGLIARALYWRPPPIKWVVLGGLLALALLSLVFYVRTGQETNQPFAAELYGSVVPSTFAPLVPLIPVHLALAMNLEVFAHVIGYYPHSMPFGHGIYDSWAIHSLVHATRLQDVMQGITAPWVVSTLAGPMWADWGFPGVVIGCAVMGALTTAPFALARRTRRLPHAALAGYFAAIAIYCVYDNIVIEFKDWVVVAAGLLIVGRDTERSGASAPVAEVAETAPKPVRRIPVGARGAAIASVAAVIALGVVVIAVANANVSDTRSFVHAELAGGWSPLNPNVQRRTLAVDPQAASLLSDPLSIDGRNGTQVIWAFSHRPGAVAATPLSVVGRRLVAGAAETLPGPPPPPGATYAVSRWGPKAETAVFEMVPESGSVRIRVIALAPAPRLVLSASAPVPPAPPGADRELAIVAQPPGAPNLVAVDRDLADGGIRIRSYSGSSNFTREISNVETRVGQGFPDPAWRLSIGAIQTSAADMVFVGTNSTSTDAELEVHVLESAAGYTTFGAQTRLGLPLSDLGSTTFLAGRDASGPLLYGVDPASRTVTELRYA